MADKLCFKDGNKFFRAHFLDEMYPENPRDENFMSNLGTMVFKSSNRSSYGDIQVEYFDEFFKEQISSAEPNDFFEGYYEFELPSLEQAQNDKKLSRFIAGTKEMGFHFDKDLYSQEMDAILSNIKENFGDEYCDTLTGGILVDEKTQKLTNTYRLDLRTVNCFSYEQAEGCLNLIKSELHSALKDLVIDDEIEDSIHHWNELDELSESQLYDKWAATKFCVVPINLYEHSGVTCHPAVLRKTNHVANDRDDGIIFNDGFIYVDKNNKEVLNELKGEARDSNGKVYNTWKAKTPEEVKEWAEVLLKGEIKMYANYLEGDVHSLEIEEFNPETLTWDIIEDGGESMIFGSEFKTELKALGYNTEHELSEEEIEKLEQTITPEFKKATWNHFVISVEKALPDFDNNVLYASKGVLFSMNQNNGNSLERQALHDYMKEIGCESNEKTISTLNEIFSNSLVKQKIKEFDPFYNGGKQYEIYFSTSHNPNSSNYRSKSAANHALVVDTENKRYGLLSGPYSFSGNNFHDYMKAPDLSTKKLREKIEQLENYGFKFQKFTTKQGEYSQGNPLMLYPKNKRKELDIDYER